MLYNYHFTPKPELIAGTLVEVSPHEKPIVLVLKGHSQEEALDNGRSIIDMQNWVFDHQGDI